VNSLPKTVTRQRRGCDLNPGPAAPESSTIITRLPSRPSHFGKVEKRIAKVEIEVQRSSTINKTISAKTDLPGLHK